MASSELQSNHLWGVDLQKDPELPYSKSPALEFQVKAQQGRARTAQMRLPHFLCETPMFMPVGTQGTVKGLTASQLEEAKCHLILGNTYHLGHRPGAELVERFGGLHSFSNWRRAMLTDSGGFQMVSLLHLAEITEQGVTFQSPMDGSEMLLTPEQSIEIQNKLGADIIMALDDVVSSVQPSRERFEEATHRTTRWMDRCIAAHARPNEQNLFAIIQGGLDEDLRNLSLEQLIARNTPGYAVGGLAGGEDKDSYWRVVAQCTAALPDNKPRYVMGIGYPLDVVICTALGADMYDSVYPTRTARFGMALVSEAPGLLRLKSSSFAGDTRPIDANCDCSVCKNYTRAYIYSVASRNMPAGAILISRHNVAYMQGLTLSMRRAIQEQRFPDWVKDFLKTQFPDGKYPTWVIDALAHVDIHIA